MKRQILALIAAAAVGGFATVQQVGTVTHADPMAVRCPEPSPLAVRVSDPAAPRSNCAKAASSLANAAMRSLRPVVGTDSLPSNNQLAGSLQI